MLLLALVAQAAAGPHLPAPPRPPSDKPCPVGALSGDVVVCARSQNAYRLKPLPPRANEPALPPAAIRIGDTTLSAEAEQSGLPGGIPVNRAMLRLKIPLGTKKQRRQP